MVYDNSYLTILILSNSSQIDEEIYVVSYPISFQEHAEIMREGYTNSRQII